MLSMIAFYVVVNASISREIHLVVPEFMAGLPELEEFESHESPTSWVRGEIFATYTINHYGDGPPYCAAGRPL